MPKRQLSTGEAIAEARASIAAVRLTDPDEHFPYKHDVVMAVLDEVTAMGPNGPDDASVRAEDFMTGRIADASAAYVDAQAAHLVEPSRANTERYEQAKDDLTAARRAHRRSRVDADGKPVANVTATTGDPQPDVLVGTRFRRAGEEG